MHRNPFLDLGYTHEMVAAPSREPLGDSQAGAASDLSARLRCLKALIDAERDERAGGNRSDQQRPGLH